MTVQRKLKVMALAVVLVAATGTVAGAAVPGPKGVIYACRHKNSGAVRVIDTQAGQRCRPSEKSLTWNQRGPQGPIGPRGPQGPAGGLATVYTSAGVANVSGAQYTVVTSLTLPAGRFLITGKGLATNQTAQSVLLACNMYGGTTRLDTSDATLPQSQSIGNVTSTATIPFLATFSQSAAGVVRVECIGAGSAPFPTISIKLTAQTVGTIVN